MPIVRKLCEALCEEAVAVAGDFENQIRSHLVAPSVVIEQLRIDMNLSVLLWRLGIGQRRIRVQQMKTDIVDAARSRCIRQYNNAGPRFHIISSERVEASGCSVMPDDLSAVS